MSEEAYRLKVKFWGVRGSIPTPESSKLEYGGNTPCVEVCFPGGEVYVFDAGTGIRNLGRKLIVEVGEPKPRIHIFLSHFHWDHIQGLPFFEPLYSADSSVTFYTPPSSIDGQILLKNQMADAYFPVDFESLPSSIDFQELGSKPVELGDLRIQPFPVNHPQGALGFQIERKGARVVYATDSEYGIPEFDQTVALHSQGASLLIYDAHYSPGEYPDRTGWGHSSWEDATQLAGVAGVESLVLFHHDPDREDRDLARIEKEAAQLFPNVRAAREGMEIQI